MTFNASLALFLFFVFGMLVQWIATKAFSRPLCKECGAKAMPNTTAAMIRAQHRCMATELMLREVVEAVEKWDDSDEPDDLTMMESVVKARKFIGLT